ncbi:hypothetical protein MC885_000486, partial [Smutsia gigantea]
MACLVLGLPASSEGNIPRQARLTHTPVAETTYGKPKRKSPREGAALASPLHIATIFDPFAFRLWWVLPGNQLTGWEWGWRGKGKDPQGPQG